MISNVAGVGSRCSSVWLFSFCLDLERILSFIVLLSLNRINFSFSLFFTVNVIDWLLLILFFVMNSIKISPCAEPMRRDAFFFHLKKKTQPWQDPVSTLLSCYLELPLFCLYDKSEEISISHINICNTLMVSMLCKMHTFSFRI